MIQLFQMDRLENFYKKVNGGYFYFIGVATSIVSIVISIVLYTAGGAAYSIFTNYISDLGALNAPNNAYLAFSAGLIINSAISPFGWLFLVIFFQNKDSRQKKTIQYWFIANIITTIGSFMVAILPQDLVLIPHVIAAFAVFIFGMLSYLIFGIIILRTDKIANYHSIPGFFLAAISIIFMMSWVFNNESIMRFFEWLVLFGGWAFGIYLGFFSLKAR